MGRIVAFNAIFFLVPFAVYAAWLMVARGTANNADDWPLKTIGFLSIGGVVLMIAALLVFIHFSGAAPDATYRPATIGKDGQIIPGTLE